MHSTFKRAISPRVFNGLWVNLRSEEGPRRAQNGPRWPQDGLNIAQERSFTCFLGPRDDAKMAPRCLHDGRSWPPEAPSGGCHRITRRTLFGSRILSVLFCVEDGSKWHQPVSRTTHDGVKRGQEGLIWFPDGLEWRRDGSRCPPHGRCSCQGSFMWHANGHICSYNK